MRAILLGLVAALVAGGAQAATSCPITRATILVEDNGFHYGGIPVERADLIGTKLRVVRYTHNPKWTVTPSGDRRLVGYDAALLRPTRGSGDIVIVEEHVVGSPPMWTASWLAGKPIAPDRPVIWNRSAGPIVHIGKPAFYGNLGPLASLNLKVVDCR